MMLTAEGLVRLDTALEHIDEHPEEWKQSDWVCGTAACLGGRINLQAGITEEPPEGWGPSALKLLGLESRNHPMFAGGNNRLVLAVWRQLLAGEELPDLRGADLVGANLEGADLLGASLRGADLRGAGLRDADLRWANLEGASLEGASLEGALMPEGWVA